ncbi:MAG: Gfo/Idh/MocA family oxidoreductase [Deltaproteobacteria bacterium]|nr:Gfo/Idh/MocA family oxidoreductase [Deltaproteobacteria bacterium]MCL4874165.1 Gfo/Idh/MocA family oxidoreductase [bacterium]
MERADSTQLKVALFGAGKMGVKHAQAIARIKGARVVAIADLLPPGGELKAALGDGFKAYRDAKTLLAEASPDVVHIVTPPETHFELARLALEHGASVYIEKPFTMRRSEAAELVRLAGQKGLRLCAGHQILYNDCTREAERLLPLIGRVVHIESYFSFRTVRRNITPAGQMTDILPHPVYLLLNFMELAERGAHEPVLAALEVRHEGEVRALVNYGGLTGMLAVTLTGRPVESYLRIIGTNGMLHVDFVRGTVVKLVGPGDNAIAIILNPYMQSAQALWKTTRSFARLFMKKQKSYPGLLELTEAFYASVRGAAPPPLSYGSITSTVALCESINERLGESEAVAEDKAQRELAATEASMPPVNASRRTVVVTGGTGFLGRKVASVLREQGWPVRVLARSIPPYSKRLPGVQYVAAELAEELHPGVLKDAEAVVHCAAETSGGADAHKRNSITATRNVIKAAADASVGKVIHISSIAVIKNGWRVKRPLSESTPLDSGNPGRGPYVWGKAESEALAIEYGAEMGIPVKVLRAGPLVDFKALKAPGRLGREVGPLFVAVGGRRSKISLCDIETAALVIASYLNDYGAAPKILNLVDPASPTREELLKRILDGRPGLRPLWIPYGLISAASLCARALMRIASPGKKPMDIASAFASERYDTSLAGRVIRKAKEDLKPGMPASVREKEARV